MISTKPTPQPLIDSFSQINHATFDSLSGEYHSLTEFVTEISKLHLCPFFADSTGDTRRIQRYRCKYGGRIRGNSVKTSCPCYVDFLKEIDGTYSFKEAHWYHNHDSSSEFYNAHWNTMTKEQIQMARQQQELGVLPGQIRANIGTNVNSNIFYKIRKPAIESNKSESLDQLLSQLNEIDFDSKVDISPNHEFISATFVYSKIASSPISLDALCLDDTSGTNVYGLPLEVILVIDSEGRSQMLGFGFLNDRTKNSYQQFLRYIKEKIGGEPRVITTDRSIAQISAIKDILPSTHIVFCRVHLRRDLLKHFECTDDVIKGFDDIHINIHLCDKYIDMISQRLQSLEGSSHEIIETLIQKADNWLPSILLRKGIFLNLTNNRSEGFFGTFKNQYGYKRFPIIDVCKKVMTFSRSMYIQSIKSRRNTDIHFDGFPCFPYEDRTEVGALALNIISEEYKELLNENNNYPWCVWCYLRDINPSLSLPCRHVMHDSNQIQYHSNDLDPRYLRTSMDNNIEAEHVVNVIDEYKKSLNFSDIMATIAPYASAAPRNPEIMSIFDKTIEELRSTKTELNTGMPPTIAIKGRLAEHPSKNVILGGAPKQKRKNKCSFCHEVGHNITTCEKYKKFK